MNLTRLLLILLSSLHLSALSANQLISTESDPDAFIQDSVNVINGNYCEATTDLLITGPDALLLQRFYTNEEGWKIFPERFLVVGQDPSKKSCIIGKERFEWTLALTGERSGGVLPYSGWRNSNGITKDPLKIDILNQAIGMVNTYAKAINGQTNHQNNQLHCKGDTCEFTLGDGTKRIYKRVELLPSLLLDEQLTPIMSGQVIGPAHFLLIQEVLPSGNQLFFSYDDDNHLIALEMKNSFGKVLSWINFSYKFSENRSLIFIKTSDNRELAYHLFGNQLTHVSGSYAISVSYEYNGNLLVKKVLPEGRFVEIAYQDNKVQSLKGPNAESGKTETVHSFSYGENYTDVFDATGIKTRYIYDKRFQLTALYTYKSGTNLLIRKFIYDKGTIKKQTFQSYNKDGVCIKVVEDDGSEEKESDLYRATERYVKTIQPKTVFPGVGLPEIIEEKALDLKTKKEILIKKFINTYDVQSNLISCDTYDANGEYAFTEKRTYTPLGQIASQTDAVGRETIYTYDGVGNEISQFLPYENKFISTTYDFHNKPVQIVEVNPEESIIIYNTYDVLGRKTASTDRFGNTTQYEYDSFHRLTKVIHPEVLDENGQAIHPTFTYTYDIFGNVLTTTDTRQCLQKASALDSEFFCPQ